MQQQQDSVLPSPSRSLETLQRHTDGRSAPQAPAAQPTTRPLPKRGASDHWLLSSCVRDPQDSNHCRLPIQGEQASSLSVSETGTEEGLACPPCYPKEAHVSQN